MNLYIDTNIFALFNSLDLGQKAPNIITHHNNAAACVYRHYLAQI